MFQPGININKHPKSPKTGFGLGGGSLADKMLHEHCIETCFDAFLPQDTIRDGSILLVRIEGNRIISVPVFSGSSLNLFTTC
ncbi:hypothetical protein Q8A67_012983 [Cirrhinus molitorella]|uniref:Uncharacterized protein n=1 Tax=Cirrhinus molitorella TaxID=172907 RepID=A0AA88TKD1_9TELE|nr:hypothetical protein Q8A67_012983 [Cirrhinus molitorella]